MSLHPRAEEQLCVREGGVGNEEGFFFQEVQASHASRRSVQSDTEFCTGRQRQCDGRLPDDPWSRVKSSSDLRTLLPRGSPCSSRMRGTGASRTGEAAPKPARHGSFEKDR